MKKILFISFVMFGCATPELPTPITPPVEKIFSVGESNVKNGQSIYFDLPSKGVYILTLINKETNQVVSREKFIGQAGENVKKIYTKTLVNRYLSIVLSDENKNVINETKIIIN